MNENIVFIGGIASIAIAIYHSMFWRIFDWRIELQNLNEINRNVMQIFNLCLIVVFLMFAYLSLFHTAELVSLHLGISILAGISIFWFSRAIMQIYFFGLDYTKSRIVTFASFSLSALYAVPIINRA